MDMRPGKVIVRAAVAEDTERIRALATSTGMFAPDELGGFDELLQGHLTGALDGHRWIVATASSGGRGVAGVGNIVGAAYYAPESFADRVWNLYFLAVDPDHQRIGIGSALIAEVEGKLRESGAGVARVLIVETSSTDQFEGARRCYQREGFTREARIRQFYGPDDDKIVFWKSLVE